MKTLTNVPLSDNDYINNIILTRPSLFSPVKPYGENNNFKEPLWNHIYQNVGKDYLQFLLTEIYKESLSDLLEQLRNSPKNNRFVSYDAQDYGFFVALWTLDCRMPEYVEQIMQKRWTKTLTGKYANLLLEKTSYKTHTEKTQQKYRNYAKPLLNHPWREVRGAFTKYNLYLEELSNDKSVVVRKAAKKRLERLKKEV